MQAIRMLDLGVDVQSSKMGCSMLLFLPKATARQRQQPQPHMGAPREVLRGAELRLWSLSSGLQEMQEQEIPPPPQPPQQLVCQFAIRDCTTISFTGRI